MLHVHNKTYPLLPLRDIVLFPHMVVPLFVGRPKSIKALEESLNSEKLIFMAAQRKATDDNPGEHDIYTIGTLGVVLQLLRLPDGGVKVLVEGQSRGAIVRYLPHPDYFQVMVRELGYASEVNAEVEALMRNVNTTFESYVKLNKKVPPEMLVSVSSIDDPDRLIDTIAAHLNIKLEDKQRLLEIEEPVSRLEKLLAFMEGEIEILHIERKIRNRVKKQMEKTQKEYYLTEQMRAIQKEMGDKDDATSELKELEEQIKKKKMSPEATDKVKKEFKKLKMMPPMSAEVTVVRNYIDWMLSLPWYEKTSTKLDIDEAERILEEDHYGLKEPKERILEYLAVQSLVEKIKGPILCFVGPPGVGKTSLARSIARATGRKFVRLSLGGVRDEAEIRGHRRTYIGALPGKILQYLKKAGSNNPVFLLDEVDKMSADFRGDPSAALLEVLDPEQNHAFNDHYIDIDYDLSEVMFITTANTLPAIPAPLQDRMEIIRLPGYTEDEKLSIATKFLVPKQVETNGLTSANIRFSENALLTIIRRYTREAGVRNLEREIASVCRKVAKEVAKNGKSTSLTISSQSVTKYLGVFKFRYGKTEEKDEIGMTTGLAWTEAGGELLSVEVTLMAGKGKLVLTGKLGDVMQESAQAALSYLRARSDLLGLAKDFFQNVDIHIHVPEGAIPKDGPSAGIAMATALGSAILKKPVRKDVAMTGEITLRGKVLPIGGLKEKLIAAHRGNVVTVIIPAENEKDLKDIPTRVKNDLKIILVDHADEVLRQALILDDPESFLKKREEPEAAYYDSTGPGVGDVAAN
ncbi:MAG TPA: endopeptidase La [Thermodesulfobacteriota bacterium]|nr:endopeptidase La [Thermodesulfobacteriota bacterium]HNU71718.1 endopeptidase La [Thermodesulfobacteriota bacterium]HOC37950.1 endopeptidase La [Thermodesulfobacteriota bacterium]